MNQDSLRAAAGRHAAAARARTDRSSTTIRKKESFAGAGELFQLHKNGNI
jgi:hypothetical protein